MRVGEYQQEAKQTQSFSACVSAVRFGLANRTTESRVRKHDALV